MVRANYIKKINKSELFNMTHFVVRENFKHHENETSFEVYKSDVDEIYKEELKCIENSMSFAVRDNKNEILGTIRVLKWDYINPLPIQKIFDINPLLCINGEDVHEIWHIGRFAIKKGVRDINLLKKLMVSAIKPICEHENNIAFAECDAKLLRVMTLMGIKTNIVGESINYLGSETIPVSMSYSGLIDFYNKNRYLVDQDLN